MIIITEYNNHLKPITYNSNMGKRKFNYIEGDLLGNKIIFIKDIESDNNNKRQGLFKCYCGNQFQSRISDIKSFKVKSCGCLNLMNITKHGDGKNTSKHHYLYKGHQDIKTRCYNKNHVAYKNYGGRGIKLYKPWHHYPTYKQYIETNLGERPEGYSLDRINNDGDYEPDNIRWATRKEQQNNRRNFNE